MLLRAQFQTAVSLIYPPRCINCGGLVETDFGLCGSCWTDTEFIDGSVCHSCGTPLPGDGLGQELTCDSCLSAPKVWDRGFAALVYGGQGRRLVLALKHGDRTDLAVPAGRWMARSMRGIGEECCITVPVPLHWTRMLYRKYNQSALLARALCSVTGYEFLPDALVRQRKTATLEGKSRDERFGILEDAIQPHVRQAKRLKGRHVLLVDDVMTSGATLNRCAHACYAAGADKVSVVVLARVVGS